MRLVALYLVQHRLALPLPAEVLRRWIALWQRGRSELHQLEQAAAQAGATLLALTAPWWLDVQSHSRVGGLLPGEWGLGLSWQLVPLRLGGRQQRLLRSRWQQAILLHETACHLARKNNLSCPWRAGQPAALGPVLQTIWYRAPGKKNRAAAWIPATEELLRKAFPWWTPLQEQLRRAQEDWAKILETSPFSPADRPPPAVFVSCQKTTADRSRDVSSSRLQEQEACRLLACAALAQHGLRRSIPAAEAWHQVVQQAQARAVVLAARLSLPGKTFCRLALDWDRLRRRQLRLRREFQHRLFQAKQHALAHWAAGAGHMLNNPLAVIAGRAQMALRDTQDPALQKHLQVIRAQAQRAHRMIAGLALYAQPPELRREWVPAEELLAELQRQFQPLARLRKVQLHWEAAPGLAVQADRYQLAVALQALVENALVAVEEGGAVAVRAGWAPAPPVPEGRPGLVIYGRGFEQLQAELPLAWPDAEKETEPTAPPWASASGEPSMEAPQAPAGQAAASSSEPGGEGDHWLELSVEDSGPGVPLEAAPWLFDPFYSGLEAGRGMGMGLCFVWRIVQQHGGAIRVDRTPSRFTLWIPQARVIASPRRSRHHCSHGAPPPPHVKSSAASRSDASAS